MGTYSRVNLLTICSSRGGGLFRGGRTYSRIYGIVFLQYETLFLFVYKNMMIKILIYLMINDTYAHMFTMRYLLSLFLE